MSKKKTLLAIALAFVLLIGGASFLYRDLRETATAEQLSEQEHEAHETEREPIKIKAPDFVVYDEDGSEVQLEDFAGKPVVLNFWASWCGPCQMEMPDFQKKYSELNDEVQFLMVNMTDGSRETMETAEAYLHKNGYDFPALYDTEQHAASTYGVYSLPRTIFIDADGYAIAQANGPIDSETLQRGIDMIY